MNRFLKTLLFLVAASIIVLPLRAVAGISAENLDSLRCGDHLVQLGETQLQVAHQCGIPDVENSYYVGSGTLDKWTYNMGSKDFIYVFTFLNGDLRNIKQTDRGF